MHHRLAVIIPYFGPLPNYFDLWMSSAARNPSIDFILLTDASLHSAYANITIHRTRLSEIKDQAQRYFDFPISLAEPYKLCDFKPAYGLIFNKHLAEYDFWAHADLDTIWGDLRKFLTPDLLHKHDRIFGGGHLSFYRNDPVINTLFKSTARSNPISYREVFADPTNFAFDEWGTARNGMNAILPDSGFSMYLEEAMPYADIKVHQRGLRTNREGFGEGETAIAERRKRNIAYLFNDGKLSQYWIHEDGSIRHQEEAYIHLQKRQVFRQEVPLNAGKFIILPPGHFRTPPATVTTDYLQRHASERGVYIPSLRIRGRNMRKKIRRHFTSRGGS